MSIENSDQLMDAIKQILPNIKYKLHEAENPIFKSIHAKLMKIQTKIDSEDYTLKSKKECNMDPEIIALSSEKEASTTLIDGLSEINHFFQKESIPTLNTEEALRFLSGRGMM